MQDPSGGVHQTLVHHVHLQSSFTYPYTPHPLTLDQALDYLQKAPQVIRELTAVAWTYLNQPPDGTVLLTWQALSQLGTNFASDGYLWAGIENVFTQEIRGNTIEIYVHESGFAPAQDHSAAHRRVRYRLVSNANNTPVDAALQIVHYMQALPDHRIPMRMFQVQPAQQQQVKERRFLESQGPLQRKEFMLNDRNNWPTMTMPGPQIPANPYQQNFMYNRPGAPQFARTPSATQQFPSQLPGMRHGSIGASPAKRPPGTMSQIPGAAHPLAGAAFATQLNEELMDNERSTDFGDNLDVLSPREISLARYKQHHEWMEEILSSPYAIKQIMPVDLTLRLAGSLSELTEPLWGSNTIKMEKADGAGDSSTLQSGKIGSEKLAEFERRVSQYLQKGEEQITSMKSAHKQKMEQLSQQKAFVDLERRLAELPFDAQNDAIDQILKEAEKVSGLHAVPRAEIVRVQDGGLLKKGEENVTQANDEFADFTNMANLDNTAGEALDFYENMDYQIPGA